MKMLTLKETYERLKEINKEIEILKEKYTFISDLLMNPKYYESPSLLAEFEQLYSEVIELKIEENFYKLQLEEHEKKIKISKYFSDLEELDEE